MDISTCPICHEAVPSLVLERHANSHFDDEEVARDFELAQAIALASPSPPRLLPQVDDAIQCAITYWEIPESSSSRHDTKSKAYEDADIKEKICCLVSLQIKETFYQVEEGVVALLKNCLELDPENSTSILSGYVDHFQSIASMDVGWGCGWRNIQMLSSHLLKQRREAREVLYGGSGFVPDIGSLQRWLEIAWSKGFDTAGSNDFDQELYGKRMWIGTTECAALLRSFGLRAMIVDFCSKENAGKRKAIKIFGPMDRYLSRGAHTSDQDFSSEQARCKFSGISVGKVNGHQVLVDWVWNYFSDNNIVKSGNQRVVLSEKAPLYFQHDGHSRTIVGIQAKRQRSGMQQYNLLILDPGHRSEALAKSLKEKVGWQKLVKRGIHTLRKAQYQLCYIDSGIACGEEMYKLKTLHSTRLEFCESS